MTDRLPPHAADAEQAVLGSLMIDQDAIATVADSLTPEAFFVGKHAVIYTAMLALWSVRRPCDYVTLCSLLESRGKLDEIGGPGFLSHLLTITPTAVYVRHYADIVLEQARKRALIDAGAELVRLGYADGDEPDYDELAMQVRRKVIAFEPTRKVPETLSERMERVRDRWLRRWAGELDDLVPTGIAEIDAMTGGGMGRRQLWVLAGRPGVSKTALALHIAKRSRSLFFSLEMPAEQILGRLAVAQAGVPMSVTTSVMGDVQKRDRLLEASERIEHLPMLVNDEPAMTTAKIQTIAARAIAEQGVQVVFIDHFSYLVDPLGNRPEHERFGELSRRCKHLADALDVPVVLLSQLNRGPEERPGCVPHMSDLRATGRLEEDAYFVGLIYRRLLHVGQQRIDANPDLDWLGSYQRVQILVEKNRNGEGGIVNLGFDPPSMTFRDAGMIERVAA